MKITYIDEKSEGLKPRPLWAKWSLYPKVGRNPTPRGWLDSIANCELRIANWFHSGVLISATDGVGRIAEKALEILGDSQREFACSEFVKLEVSPKAVFNKQTEEAQFYEEFFSDVTYWASDLTHIVQEAYQIASQYGLAAMDALHVAAALSVGAEELVTTEKRTKPMHRVTSINVVSIFD